VPVETLLAEPDLDPALRSRLERSLEVRRSADALGLAVGGHYLDYVEWPGDALLVSLVSTEPGAIEPVTSWFPIVGAVPYRGYFDPARADREAERRRERGLDVCRVKVRAYSTLGWFSDPLTGPLLRQPEPLVVETLFHELLHASVFAPGAADFNEGVASFVGQEARVRFYAQREGEAAGARERRAVEATRRVQAEIGALRRQVEALYAEAPDGPERRAGRARLEAETRARIAALEGPERGPAFASALELGDACLALAGTYHGDLARWSGLLAALDGDLGAFIARARRAAETPDPRASLAGSAPSTVP